MWGNGGISIFLNLIFKIFEETIGRNKKVGNFSNRGWACHRTEIRRVAEPISFAAHAVAPHMRVESLMVFNFAQGTTQLAYPFPREQVRVLVRAPYARAKGMCIGHYYRTGHTYLIRRACNCVAHARGICHRWNQIIRAQVRAQVRAPTRAREIRTSATPCYGR
jgi:hypothetical protein